MVILSLRYLLVYIFVGQNFAVVFSFCSEFRHSYEAIKLLFDDFFKKIRLDAARYLPALCLTIESATAFI